MRQNLPNSDRKTLAICQYYQWFIPAVDKWMDLAKLKAHHRVRRAAELDRICTGEMIVKHCTSAVDATACFYQVKANQKLINLPSITPKCSSKKLFFVETRNSINSLFLPKNKTSKNYFLSKKPIPNDAHREKKTNQISQIKEFWKQLAWPDLAGSCTFVLKIIDVS